MSSVTKSFTSINDRLKLVSQAFSMLKTARKVGDVQEILGELGVPKKNHMSEKKYPPITFGISAEEIMQLRKRGFLSADDEVSNIYDADPLAKLLYAMLWKNGDLLKVSHIVKGICSIDTTDNPKDGVVFFQFGKYLQRTGEPIIDQHVMRAFSVHLALERHEDAKTWLGLKSLSEKHHPLIKEYKAWLKNGLQVDLRGHKDHVTHVDRVLFAVGKTIKQK